MDEEWEIIGPEDDEEWEIEDTYDPNLASIRSSFQSELADPQARELLAASTVAEVGDQPLHVQKSYMETVLNRAAARGSTVTDTVLDPDYYPSITHRRISRKMGNFQNEEMQQLDSMIDQVVKGSNVSGYATGNESGDVHSGGAPVSYNPGTGERFVQENPDLGWVKKTQSDAQEEWEIIAPGKKEGKLTEAQPEEEFEIIPPQQETTGTEGSVGPPSAIDVKTAYQTKQSPVELVDMVDAGINAGKEVWESGKRGLMSAGLGLGETINRYAYSPIVHGIREAIDYIAPDSDLAKTAKYIDDEFYKNTVEIPAAQRAQLGKESAEAGTVGEVAHAVGQMAGDLPSIMLTSGLLPELKVGMELVNTLRHGAAAMTVPAMRAGTDAAEQVKKAGGSEMEQLGAFIRGTTITMGIGAVPMATKSGAASMAGRVAERAVKSVPLASAAVESGRMLDNAASDLFGGEKRPFSIGEHLKQVAPLVLVGGVAGRDTRPSKFERTFGFSPVHLDKAEWMRHRMDAEGIAKVTPEKVTEWEVAWKETQRELPTAEEAPPVTPEAAFKPEAVTPKGGPVEVKRSAQALGIVASPKAAKGFEQAREEAKAIADYLNKAEHWGPWNSAVGNNVAANQKALDNVQKQAEAFKKLVPDESERKGATMYREADGDMAKITGWGANVKNAEARAAYRSAGAMTPKGKELVDRVAQRFKELNIWLNANGIDVAERMNYVTHMLHTSGVQPTTGAPLRSLSSFFRYAKTRTYDSFFQAFQAGEKPKTLDIVDILSAYEISAQRAVNNKKFVDRLKFGQARDGKPIVARSSLELRQLGYKALDAPGLERMLIHPDHFDDLSKILGRSKIQDWLEKRSNNPLLNVGKGVLQAGAEAQKYMKGTIFSLSFFHQLTEGTHAVGHRVNPFKTRTERIDLNDPKQYDAAVHGLMLRPDKISQEMFLQGVGSDSYNLVTLMARKFGGDAGKGVADFIDGYSHYLFESYIPRLKMDTYQHIVERNTARFAKDLKSGKVSMAEVKSLSADQANAAYGHLNYTKLARSPTVRHAMQLLLLAPDFFEARARFAAQAGKGAVGLLTGSKTGTEQLIALTLLGVGQYVAARILNQLDHGDPEWDPEHALQVKTDLGGFLPDKRWVGLRSVPEDIHKAFKDPWQFMLNRFSPFARLAGESAFKTNWRGEKTDFDNSLRDMIFNVVPMPLQGLTPQLREMLPKSAQEMVFGPRRAQSLAWYESLLKSTGVQIHRVSPLNDAFQMAEDWTKVNDPEEYARRQASAFPESKYRSLRYALEDSDWEAARTEAKRLREGGATVETFQQSILRPFTGSFANDQKLYKSLDKYDKAIFDAALRRRAEILKRYRQHVNSRADTKPVSLTTLHQKMKKAEEEEIKKARKKKKHPL